MIPMPRLFGAAVLQAESRVRAADFVVEEIPSFEASGDGEHLLLTIRKRNRTTAEVVTALQRWADVGHAAIGYAGLKDRHGITTQRFTVQLPGREAPAFDLLRDEQLEILDHARHRRKLPKGASFGNAFALRLRNVEGDRAAIEQRLAQIREQGIANAFGEQRFGRGDNIAMALSMFAGNKIPRGMRSILLSSARAAIFNAQLARRIAMHRVFSITDGDVLMLAGSRSIFGPVTGDAELTQRLQDHDVTLTAPLWGRGELRTDGEIREMELAVVEEDAQLRTLAKGLRRAGLEQERRAVTVMPSALRWNWPDEHTLELQFCLPPGSYATALLHELGEMTDRSTQR